MSRRALVLFLALSFIWGIPYFFIKIAIEDFTPLIVVFMRTFIAALVMIPLAHRRGDLLPALKAWRWVLVFAVLEMVIPWWLLNDSETRISSGLAALLLATVPIVSTVINSLWGTKGAWHRDRILGMTVGFVGVLGLVWLDIQNGSADLRSIIQMVLVAIGYSLAPAIASRKLKDISIIGLVGLSAAMVALIYLPITIATWDQVKPTASGYISVGILGLICTATAFVVMFELIKLIGPIRITLVTYINPAVAIAMGVLFLQEKITLGMIVGFPLVLIGSYLATRSRELN